MTINQRLLVGISGRLVGYSWFSVVRSVAKFNIERFYRLTCRCDLIVQETDKTSRKYGLCLGIL
jgi:hypothetical protein